MESVVRGVGAGVVLVFAMLLGSGLMRGRGLGLRGCAKAAEREKRMVRV